MEENNTVDVASNEVVDAEAEEIDTSKLTNDPEVAEDLKNLSKSKLTLESFEEYMRLRNEQEKLLGIPADVWRHQAKTRSKKRRADKLAKIARKKNRAKKH